MDDFKLFDGEQIDELFIKELKIIQRNDNFRYGTDAVLLSKFAEVGDNEKVLDIGTGSGILPILLSAKNDTSTFVGIDVQEKMVETAKRSAKLNKIENRLLFKTLNITDILDEYPKRYFDVVVTNPPYKRKNSGIVNGDYEHYIARNEVLCTLKDIIEKASTVLKTGGRFYMVQRPDRLADSIELMRKYSLEPKLLTMVHSDFEKPPVMFLIKGVQGAGKELIITKPILIGK